MVRNDFLLRLLLFAGIFWITRFYAQLFVLFFGAPLNWSLWISIVIAVVIAFKAHTIPFESIKNSILKRQELGTTVRWVLYVLVGITITSALYTFTGAYIFEDTSIETLIFTGEFLERLKGFGAIVLILAIAYFVTKTLVNMVGYDSPIPQSQNQKPLNTDNGSIRNRNDKYTIHGSSEFLPTAHFNQKYNQRTDKEMHSQFEQTGGYVIMPNAIKYLEHTHMVTIAGSGQGKGTTAIIPNLLTQPQNSWVILDVKGENAAVTARFQKQCGQKVFILDPFDVQRSIKATHGIARCGFNPLVVAKYLPPDEVNDFASMIAEMFIPEDSGKASSDSFWSDSGRNLIKSYILYLLTEDSITNKTIGLLYEWLRLDIEGQAKLWIDMSYNEKTKFASNEIQSLALGGEKTWVGILSEARRATSFLDSPLIKASLESDQFDPMTLQTNNSTVYVILPERNLNTHKTWLRLVFGTILKLCNFTAKRRVNFLMDEFPILGRMDDFVRAFAFGRGQGISCWIFGQSLAQLKEIYGENSLNTILTNATLRQFFGMNDHYTQKYVSDLLGTTTEVTSTGSIGTNSGSTNNTSKRGLFDPVSEGAGVSQGSNSGYSEQLISRPLLTPEEVGKLKNEFVLLVNGDKYLIKKYPYYHPNIYPGRYDPNPYVSQLH